MTKEIKVADIIDPLNYQIPIAFKWTIKKEDLEKKIFLYKASPYLLPLLPGVFIQFSIIKDGYNGDKIMFDNEVNLGPEKRIRSDMKIRVKSANFCKWAIAEVSQKGFYSANFTTQTDLLNPERNFFVDANLELDITGILSVDRPNDKFLTEFFHYFLGAFNMNDMKSDYDFSIFVQGKEIKVHKNVMADASTAFAGMFQSNWKECNENKMELKGFDYKTVKFGIDLCYDNKFIEDLNLSFYADVLRLADMYDMGKVKGIIEDEIEQKINSHNIVEIANLAVRFNAAKLRQRCIDFILCSIYKKESLSNIDQLDKDLADEIFQQQSYYQISETVERKFYE